MITDFILVLIGSFIALISGALSLISFVMPQAVFQSISYFIGFLDYASGIINITELMAAIGVLLSFYGIMYSVKIILLIYHAIPFFGKKVDFPTIKLKFTKNK